MNEIIQKAYAKINLFLDVSDKLENGYHELNSIMINVDLHDIITITKTEASEITLTSNNTKMPLDERNFCHKVAQVILTKHNIQSGININIEKKIPFIGGLGGGSADAAATIKALNTLFELNMTNDEMINIIKPITTDGCYCIVGKTCHVSGIGDKIKQITNLPKLYIGLIKHSITVPHSKTKWMYENLDNLKNRPHPNINTIIESINNSQSSEIINNMYNCFETIDVKEYQPVKETIIKLKNTGIDNVLLCGSGPTVLCISKNKESIKKIKNDIYSNMIITGTI